MVKKALWQGRREYGDWGVFFSPTRLKLPEQLVPSGVRRKETYDRERRQRPFSTCRYAGRGNASYACVIGLRI